MTAIDIADLTDRLAAGGVVEFDHRVYDLPSPIVFPDRPVTLVGRGAWDVRWCGRPGDGLWNLPDNVRGAVFRVPSGGTGFVVPTKTQCVFENVVVLGTDGTGVGFDFGPLDTVACQVTTRNCFAANLGVGVRLTTCVSTRHSGLYAAGNKVGLQFAMPSGGNSDNTFRDTKVQSNEVGIQFDVGTGVRFYDTLVQDNDVGIAFSPTEVYPLHDNTFVGGWWEANGKSVLFDTRLNHVVAVVLEKIRSGDQGEVFHYLDAGTKVISRLLVRDVEWGSNPLTIAANVRGGRAEGIVSVGDVTVEPGGEWSASGGAGSPAGA